jgi:hypothetical protein
MSRQSHARYRRIAFQLSGKHTPCRAGLVQRVVRAGLPRLISSSAACIIRASPKIE